MAAAGTAWRSQALELPRLAESQAMQLRAQAQATSVRLNGGGQKPHRFARLVAKAGATTGMEALGSDGYTAVQVATILGEHKVKVVPTSPSAASRRQELASVMMARLIAGESPARCVEIK